MREAAPNVRKSNVRGAVVTADAVAEDDDLVAATGEGIDHVDRLRESRVIRVDDLGDEDDAHRR